MEYPRKQIKITHQAWLHGMEFVHKVKASGQPFSMTSWISGLILSTPVAGKDYPKVRVAVKYCPACATLIPVDDKLCAFCDTPVLDLVAIPTAELSILEIAQTSKLGE